MSRSSSSKADPVLPLRRSSRRSSLASPARVSGRSSFKDSFASTPGRSILSDNTDIEQPRRQSWWKKLDDNNSRDIIEAMGNEKVDDANNVLEDLDVEILSQEKERRNFSLDLPDSSGSETIDSIIIPERKLFTQKENIPQKKFSNMFGPRESIAKLYKPNTEKIKDITTMVGPKKLFSQAPTDRHKIFEKIIPSPIKSSQDDSLIPPKKLFNQENPQRKTIFPDVMNSSPKKSEDILEPEAGPKILFPQNTRGRKSIFPSALLDTSADKTANKTTEARREVQGQVRSLFGNRPTTKRKNMFADFIVVESEDEVPDIQPRMFRFGMKPDTMRRGSSTSHALTDAEDDWKMLPSSTMMEHMEGLNSPIKRPKLSTIPRERESEVTHEAQVLTDDENVPTSEQAQNKTYNKNKSLSHLSVDKNATAAAHTEITHNKSLPIEIVRNDSDAENVIQKIANITKHTENLIQNKTQTRPASTSPEDNGKMLSSSTIMEHMEGLSSPDKRPTRSESEVAHEAQVLTDGENVPTSKQAQNKTYNKNKSLSHLSVDKNVTAAAHTEITHNKSLPIEIVRNDSDAENVILQIANITKHTENLIQNKTQTRPASTSPEDNGKMLSSSTITDHIEGLSLPEKRPKLSTILSERESEVAHEAQVLTDDENVPTSEQAQNKTYNKNKSRSHPSVAHEAEVLTDDENVPTNEQAQNKTYNKNKSVSHPSVVHETEVLTDDENVPTNEQAQNKTYNKNKSVSHPSVAHEAEVLTDDENVPTNEQAQNKTYNKNKSVSHPSVAHETEVLTDDENVPTNEQAQNKTYNKNKSVSHLSFDKNATAAAHTEITHNKSLPIEIARNDSDVENVIQQIANIPNRAENRIQNKTQTINKTMSKTEMQEPVDIEMEAKSIESNDKTSEVSQNVVDNQENDASNKEATIKPDTRNYLGSPRDSSAEGSGWDSHRTTRKTLRQTFGKDFTPRKSLRALVMEKSAKRQTEYPIRESVGYPQANSTELVQNITEPQEMEILTISSNTADIELESAEPMTPDVSIRTRQTTLEMYLENIRREVVERKRKSEVAVKKLLTAPKRDMSDFYRASMKRLPRSSNLGTKPRTSKSKPSAIPLERIPEEILLDMKYKPPKRFMKNDASWITKRLYKYLETKLEPKYDFKARVKAEKFVEHLYYFAKSTQKLKQAPQDSINELKIIMARLDIVTTHHEFYEFFYEFMPREVRIKVVPDITNKLPVPKHGIFIEIIRAER